MIHALLLVTVVLGQEPAEAAPPPAEAAPAAQPAGEAAPAAEAAPPAPRVERNKNADEVAKTLAKMATMSPEERIAAMQDLQKRFGAVDFNPVLPPPDLDVDRYLELGETDQVKVTARRFFLDLAGGDPNAIIARSGVPFYLEDRRLDRLEDLRSEWSKNLRKKRTDLITLYDIEVLTPAAMEKKYGKPPSRLRSWNLSAPKTYFAVGNLSGRAAVVLLKQSGIAWQVVGYHD